MASHSSAALFTLRTLISTRTKELDSPWLDFPKLKTNSMLAPFWGTARLIYWLYSGKMGGKSKISNSQAMLATREAEAYDSMNHFGEWFASHYRGLSDSETALSKASSTAVGQRAHEVDRTLQIPTNANSNKWLIRSWFMGIIILILFAANAAVSGNSGTAATPISFFIGLAIVIWLAFLASWHFARSSAHEERLSRMKKIGSDAFYRSIMSRRDLARAYDPDARFNEIGFNQGGPAPLPQPYGVTHQGAEQLVADWVRFLGESDAIATQFVSDGGIDVESTHYIAQVKNYSGPVGVAAIRELAGVGAIDGRKLLFFTSGYYPTGAIEFAEKSDIALFVYNAQLGTIAGINGLAKRAIERGL